MAFPENAGLPRQTGDTVFEAPACAEDGMRVSARLAQETQNLWIVRVTGLSPLILAVVTSVL
jgi:hypothetical protein